MRPERVNKWSNFMTIMIVVMMMMRRRRRKIDIDLANEHKLIFPSESYAVRRESHREQILPKRQHKPTVQ